MFIILYFPYSSYDTRTSQFHHGETWADEKHLGNRASFRSNVDPPILVLKEVQVSDGGTYTCKVDYEGGTREPSVTYVNLTVIGKFHLHFYLLFRIFIFSKS